MTEIAMDPEVMKKHAETHDLVAEEAKKALALSPASIDGGLGADSVATIVSRLINHVDAVFRVHGTLSEIVTSIANDSTKTEEEISASITALANEVEDDE